MATPRRSRPQGRPLASAPGASRDALLDAAASLFGEKGVAATTTAEIATRAGVTAAMVHYHFKGRDALLDTLVRERLGPLMAFVWAPVRPDEAPVPMVEGLVQRLLEGPGSQPWLPPLWVREVLSEGGQLRERVLAQLPAAKIQAVSTVIAKAQKRGEVNPDLEARLFVLSLLGLTMLPLATAGLWKRLPGAADLDSKAIARHATVLLTAGLRPPRRSR